MEKKIEKRLPRSYKAKETPYYKAVRRAWKGNNHLVNILESVVEAYANGHDIYFIDKNKNKQIIAE